jgi:hypothetical protein
MREALEKELAELRTELKSLKRQPQALPIEEGMEKAIPEALLDSLVTPLKANFSGSQDYMSGINDGLYTMARRLLQLAPDEWDSHALIGRVKDRFEELKHKQWQWSSFYHGWLEGRADMLKRVLPELSSLRTQLSNKLKDIEKLTEELGKAQEENEALKTKLQLNNKEGK